MALQLTYQMFTKLVGWIVLHTRSDTTKDIEINQRPPTISAAPGGPDGCRCGHG